MEFYSKTLKSCFCSLLAAIATTLVVSMMSLISVTVSGFRLLNTLFGIRLQSLDPIFYEKWFSFNICLQTIQTVFRDNVQNLMCETKAGSTAPNICIQTLEGVEKMLLDLEHKGRPLVVNFGSCS